MAGPPRTAYRLRTPRLLVRAWEPADAPGLVAAIAESLENLRAWMPWATEEPRSLADKTEYLRQARGAFDLDQDHGYAVFDRDGATLLGAAGLHARGGAGVLEIGYWTRAGHVGLGVATEAAAALTAAGFIARGARRLHIQCDPANVRSAAVARRLGYVHEGTLRGESLTPAGAPRDTMVWGMLAAEYPESPAARTPVEMYDVMGERIGG